MPRIYKIGVFGSAGAIEGGDAVFAALNVNALHLGQEIAKRGAMVLTGACPGLPHSAAVGAHGNGVLTLGFSPAQNLQEHRKMGFPDDDFYILVFTGFGCKGRNVPSVRSCDAAIFINGQRGTLNELTIALDEAPFKGFPIGLLMDSGGVADGVDVFPGFFSKPTQAVVIRSSDPATLVEKIFAQLAKIN